MKNFITIIILNKSFRIEYDKDNKSLILYFYVNGENYFDFIFHKIETIKALWRCWDIQKPKYYNWSRFYIMTPFVTFDIKGYLFWGKKP